MTSKRWREADTKPDDQEWKRKRNPEIPLGTFMVFGDAGLDHKHLVELLTNHGWSQLPKPPRLRRGDPAPMVEFVWAELEASFRFDPVSYSVRCVLKNVLQDEAKKVVTDKGQLHDALQLRFPEISRSHIAATRLLRDVKQLATGEVLILRPVGQWAWAGNGIFRVATQAELDEAKRELLPKSPNAIASEYIVDPLLWQGLKMHLRMYWLVCAEAPGFPFRTLLWERGKILTAKKLYSAASFFDKDMHDSHAKSTPRNLFFPEDLEGVCDSEKAEIWCQMRDLLQTTVSELLKPHAIPYSESLMAYEVFGCDFLVTAAQPRRVVLMEINERVGFQPVEGDRDLNHRYEQFTRDYYAWVHRNAIAPMIAAWHVTSGVPSKVSDLT